jgi:hypothetical protein
MKIKRCAGLAAMVLLSGISVYAAPSSQMTPGGIPKKYVGLLFDVFQTTPSNVLANADQFPVHTPYLDGVAIGLQDVQVVDDEGNKATVNFHQIMNPKQRWTRDAVKDQLPYLKEIAKKPNLTESLLIFWITPVKGARINWDDDKGWANFAENMATVAWLAKEAGLKGLMLDPEEYSAQGGQVAQYIHCYRDPAFPETAKLARQRGREVFSRVFKEFPDAIIWSLWCFNKFAYWLEAGRQQYPVNNIEQSGELLHHFLNGMMDVLPPQARVVEGAEHYSGSALDNAYIQDLVKAATTALALVEPENMAKYRSQFYYGNTHYLDMYKMNANPNSLWYFGPVDGSRLEHMRLNFEQSLRVATGYVWLYGEGSGKVFNWRNGHYAKAKTWEEVAPGMTETIMLVKNPSGLAAQRKAELAKNGKLKNLAKHFKSVKLAPTSKARVFNVPEEKMPSAKDLKPGERYLVTLNVIEKGAEKGTFREGTAIAKAFWRKNGKRTGAKPMTLKPMYEMGRNGRGIVPAFLKVTVPEDADELVFDLGAKLELREHVCFWSLSMQNLLDPVKSVENTRKAKWTFDAEKKTLSDGNWTLAAVLDKKKGTLTVRGDNENTIGSGVLDFSNVKADTGYAVASLGKFKNFGAITALFAPDAVSSCDSGIFGCSNLTQLVVGKITPPKNAKTPELVRMAELERFGYKLKKPTNFKITDRRHRFIYPDRPKTDLSVKGVKPGELYTVGLSMKRKGPGYVYIFARFRGNGEEVKSKERVPAIVMTERRAEDVWQSGEVVLRVPQGADEIYFDITAEVTEDHTSVEFDKFEVIKIGDPLPVWPPETVREKVRK